MTQQADLAVAETAATTIRVDRDSFGEIKRDGLSWQVYAQDRMYVGRAMQCKASGRWARKQVEW